MIPPKEKAKELVDKMFVGFRYSSINCALEAVDEILNFISVAEIENIYWIKYWQEVKTEIDKL